MSAERFDRGKWWFASKDSKVYVVRKNSLVKTRGKDLEEVIRITPSSSKPDQLKVSWVTLCQHLIKYLFNAFLLLLPDPVPQQGKAFDVYYYHI